MTPSDSEPDERRAETAATSRGPWSVVESAKGPGDRIGPYRILDTLGRGGFGIVYLAEQREPVRRRVALKMILLGMETEAVIARFDAERQALAVMNHPNVATVYDAGTSDDGRPYFVMEHVPGVPVTDYCDEGRIEVQARLRIFLQICDAVQHAHQKGIIHRDIKPSNVLVFDGADGPLAKVIDFGVAKAIDRQLTEKTLFTRVGQLVGTPEYMSPEQANPSVRDVDTRTDIYSLGVLLYELLVGARPFDPESLRSAGLAEIQRIIREIEPARPSTRLSQLGVKTAEVATSRHTDPSSLARVVRGDLDWITMRAMEKDRARRYPSASELAEDIRRYLRHEPVTAGPPSAWYRLGKLVRRHRAKVAVASLMLLLLVAGVVGTTTQAVRATRSAAEARYRSYVGQVAAAAGAVEANEMQAARRHLDLAPAEHRGWEWHYLDERADESERVLEGHRDVVVAVAASADGTRLASASVDCRMRVWDATTGATIVELEPAKRVKAMAFMTNDTVATMTYDGNLAVWDLGTKSSRRVGDDAGSPQDVVAFEEGRRVAVSRAGDAVVIHDLERGTRTTMPLRGRQVTALAFVPGGEFLMIGDRDGRLAVVSVRDGAVRREWPAHDAAIRALAVAADGAAIGSGGDDGRARLWDLEGTMRREHVHTGPVRGMAAIEGGSFAASSHDRTMSLLEVDGDAPPVTLRGHGGRVYAVAALPGRDRIVSASEDTTVRLWRTDASVYRRALDGHASMIASVAISADDRRVASTSKADGAVLVWDADRRALLRAIGGGEVRARRCVLDGTGRELVTLEDDGTFRRWDVDRGTELGRFAGGALEGDKLAFAATTDGRRIAWSDAERRVRTIGFDLAGERTITTPDSVNIVDLAWDAAGSRLAVAYTVGDEGGRVEVWDVASASPTRASTIDFGMPAPAAVALTPDGRNLVISRHRDRILVLDVGDTSVRRELDGIAHARLPIRISPDASRLFVAWPDNSIRVWDLPRGERVLALRGHTASANSMAISGDGTRLVTGGADRRVRLWESRP